MKDLHADLREGPQEDSVTTIVHELADATRQLIAEQKHTEKMMLEVSPKDRELTRAILLSRAKELKKIYPKMTIPEIRRHLHLMLTVSV